MRNPGHVKQIYADRAIPWRVRDIIEKECAKRFVHVEDILGPSRLPNLVKCRKAIYLTLRSEILPSGEARFSYTTIAKWFGKDHTTVCLACSEKMQEARRVRSAAFYQLHGKTPAAFREARKMSNK